jgi:hypothetical protein
MWHAWGRGEVFTCKSDRVLGNVKSKSNRICNIVWGGGG